MARVSITGCPILITGASSGIGAATAAACARAGMRVMLCARRIEKLEGIAEDIRRAGGDAVAAACDVTDAEACREAVARAVEAFGSLYAVFANAGYAFERPTLETTDAEFRALLETNFWGTVNIVKPAVSVMLDAGRGHVLICSSCLSKIGLPFYSPYTISKAAQDHWGRALRLELRARGVCVSTIHPVSTSTDLFDTAARHSGGQLQFDRGGPSSHRPAHVAERVVACLRKPRSEVWMSRGMRLLLAAATACPGLADRALTRMAKRRGRPLE